MTSAIHTSYLVKTAKTALSSHSISLVNFTLEDCSLAYEANTNSLIQTIRVVHTFFCLFGVVTSSLSIFVLLSRSSRTLHVNLRLSLASLSFAAWIASAQLFFTAVYSLTRSLADADKCDALTDSGLCALIRFPVVLSIYATLAGIFVLAAERGIATVKYKTYEAQGSRLVAAVLITAQWCLSVIFACMSSVLRTEPGVVQYCTVYISHPKSAVISLCAMSILETGALVFFVLLLHSNKRRQVKEFVNNAMHTLTERYQLQENVRIMSILIPSLIVHAAMGLLGSISMLSFAIFHGANEGRMLIPFATFSELVLLVVPIYAIVFPLVAILWNKQLRHATRRALPCLFNKKEIVCQIERDQRSRELTEKTSRQLERDSDAHFELLNEMWTK